MQMLLAAALVRLQITEANRGKSSKVILLIADSMAVREGAEQEKVSRVVRLYKKSLEPLLGLLNIREYSEIVLSSDIEGSDRFREVLESIEESPIVKQLKTEDEGHYAYIRTQTAITCYMNRYRDVGVKVGWICAESRKQMSGRVSPRSLKHWDELKFDRWCEAICRDSTIRYLYAKAGLKQSKHDKQVKVCEGCPYTAYPQDRRYIIQTQVEKDIRTICPIQKQVAAHWKGVAEVCSDLMQAGLVHRSLLPEGCVKKSNVRGTVYNMLNHWVNSSMFFREVVSNDSTFLFSSGPLSVCTYHPMAEDSFRSIRMREMTLVGVVNKPEILQRCTLL